MAEAHPKQDFLIVSVSRFTDQGRLAGSSDVTINVMPHLDYCSRIASLWHFDSVVFIALFYCGRPGCGLVNGERNVIEFEADPNDSVVHLPISTPFARAS